MILKHKRVFLRLLSVDRWGRQSYHYTGTNASFFDRLLQQPMTTATYIVHVVTCSKLGSLSRRNLTVKVIVVEVVDSLLTFSHLARETLSFLTSWSQVPTGCSNSQCCILPPLQCYVLFMLARSALFFCDPFMAARSALPYYLHSMHNIHIYVHCIKFYIYQYLHVHVAKCDGKLRDEWCDPPACTCIM